jgi:uncharacterized protein
MRESRHNVWADLGSVHYVYNAASGAFRRISAGDHAALERFLATCGRECCPLPVLLDLVRDGVLVADELDEVDALRRRYVEARHDVSQLNLVILTSLGCNFACPYCYEAKHPSLMTEEVQRGIVQYVDERLHRLTRLDVTWFGGEPLLGRAALFDLSAALMARCATAGVRYGADIVTNGYLLDEPTSRRLAANGVETAQVTLDGPPAVHDRRRPLASGRGTFWTIVNNLSHAVRHLKVTVRANIDGENYEQAAALFAILAAEGLAGKLTVYPGHLRWDEAASARENGCGECGLDPREFARFDHEFAALAARSGFASWSPPQPTALNCTGLSESALVVGAEGELYRCLGLAGKPAAVIGDIRNTPTTGDGHDTFPGYNPFADAECRTCIALPVCMGGCARDAVAANGATRANRCHEFRYTHHDLILRCAEAEEAKLQAV